MRWVKRETWAVKERVTTECVCVCVWSKEYCRLKYYSVCVCVKQRVTTKCMCMCVKRDVTIVLDVLRLLPAPSTPWWLTWQQRAPRTPWPDGSRPLAWPLGEGPSSPWQFPWLCLLQSSSGRDPVDRSSKRVISLMKQVRLVTDLCI